MVQRDSQPASLLGPVAVRVPLLCVLARTAGHKTHTAPTTTSSSSSLPHLLLGDASSAATQTHTHTPQHSIILTTLLFAFHSLAYVRLKDLHASFPPFCIHTFASNSAARRSLARVSAPTPFEQPPPFNRHVCSPFSRSTSFPGASPVTFLKDFTLNFVPWRVAGHVP